MSGEKNDISTKGDQLSGGIPTTIRAEGETGREEIKRDGLKLSDEELQALPPRARRYIQHLLRRNERLITGIEAGQAGIFEWNVSDLIHPEMIHTLWHEGMERLFGLPPDSLSEQIAYPQFLERVHPEDREAFTQANFGAIRDPNKKTYDIPYRITRADTGEPRWVWGRGEIERDETGKGTSLIGTIHDVSDRHTAEQYQEQLFENSPIAIAWLDNEDRILRANKAFQELFGYTHQELFGEEINTRIVPQGYEGEASGLSQDVLSSKPIIRETKRCRKDGTMVDVQIVGYPIIINGKQVGIYAMYQHITQSKKEEQELLEEKILTDALVEHMPCATYIVTPKEVGNSKVRETSKISSTQLEQLTGYTKEEWLADPMLWYKIIHPDDQERVLGLVHAINRGEAKDLDEKYRIRPKGSSEYSVWVWNKSKTIKRPNGDLFTYGFMFDITASKKLEEMMAKASSEGRHTEVMRTLTLGLNNDTNNLLQHIRNVVEEIRRNITSVPTVQQGDVLTVKLGQIDHFVDQAHEVIDQLTRIGKPLDLSEAYLEDLSVLLKNILQTPAISQILEQAHIQVKVELPPIPPARLDPQSFGLALHNIILNACESMQRQRQSGDTSALILKVQGVMTDTSLQIRIQDNGTGVAKAYWDQIFDPYFTTSQSSGTLGKGFGLHLARDAVQSHRGTLAVESSETQGTVDTELLRRADLAMRGEQCSIPMPNRGTVMALSVPFVEGVKAKPVLAVKERKLVNGRPVIAMVDDDTDILHMNQLFLAMPAENCQLAQDGLPALRNLILQALKPDGLLPHIVITDNMMFDVHGVELMVLISKLFSGDPVQVGAVVAIACKSTNLEDFITSLRTIMPQLAQAKNGDFQPRLLDALMRAGLHPGLQPDMILVTGNRPSELISQARTNGACGRIEGLAKPFSPKTFQNLVASMVQTPPELAPVR